MFIDIRTFFSGYVLSILLCSIVMASLWWQNRKHHPEIVLWLVDYVLQFIALLLITFRGILPDFFTIVLANLFVIGGTIILYIGLGRYVGKESRQWHNYLMLVVFTLVHAFLTYIYPDIALRTINISLALIYICSQGFWLMVQRVDPDLQPATKATGIVFALFCIVSAVQISVNLTIPKTHNIFVSGFFNLIAILMYQILFVALTFTLSLLVSRRLSMTLESELIQRNQIEKSLRNSEERVRLLLNSTAEAIYGIDPQGNCTFANPSSLRMLGYSNMEQLLGKNMHNLIHHSYPNGTKMSIEECKIFKAFRKGKGEHADDEVLWRSDGTSFPVEYWSYPQIANGEACGAVVTFIDITERKYAERSLKERLKELNCLYNIAAVIEIPDISLDEILEKTVTLLPSAMTYPEITKARIELEGQSFHTSGFRQMPWILTEKINVNDKQTGHVEVCYLEERPISDVGPFLKEEQQLLNAVAERLGRVIERKRSEEQLRLNETRLRSLLEIMQHRSKTTQEFLDYALNEAIKITQSKIGYIYFYNEDRRQFILNTWSKDVMKECTITDPQTCYELEKTGVWGEAVRQRKPIILNDFQADHPLKKGYPGGHAHLNKFMTVPILKDDAIVAVVGVANKSENYDEADVLQLTLLMDAVWKSVDIKMTEERLRESEERIRAITTSARDAIIVIDNSGNVSFWNPAAEQILGYSMEEAIGKNLHELIAPERFFSNYRASFPEFQKTGQGNAIDKTLELAARRKDGREIDVALSLSAVNIKGVWNAIGIVQDITERKKAEQSLTIERQRLASILEGTNVGTWEWNVQTGETIFNERWAEIIGYTLEELAPISINTWEKFVHPDDSQVSSDLLQKHFNKELPYYECEARMKHKDGTWVWVLDRGKVATWTNDGKPLMMSGTHQDITERKKAEEELSESEERYRFITNNSADHIWTMDLSLGFSYSSPAVTKIFGYTMEDFMAQPLDKFFTPESLSAANKMLMEELQTDGKPNVDPNRIRTFQTEHYHKNGKTIWVESSMIFIRDASLKPIGILGVTRDITERKKAEEALRRNELFLNTLLTSIPIPVFYKDRDGRYMGFNKAYETFFGATKEKLIGKTVFDISPPELAKIYYDKDKELLESRGEQRYESQVRNTLGETRDVIFNKAVLTDDKGIVSGLIGALLDITDRKQAEAKLLDINRQLEDAIAHANEMATQAKMANEAKSDFLANISHEIRTPMNAIIGMADLLWDSPLTIDQRQYVQIFRSAGENLLTLINDLLDLSKIESGQMTVEHINYDLIDAIEKTCEVMALRAQSKNLELVCHITPDVPQHIHGDPTRLRQVLINILGNAVKFTEKGEIILTVTPVKPDVSDKRPAFLQFSVIDTGIGIPAEKLDVIFEKFTQSDTSITRKYEGTGLGLAISKQLIEMMGGRIWVESKKDEGSTFYFTVPLEEASPDEERKSALVPESNLKEMKILIVDDNATNRLILREILTQWGCSVTEAAKGKDALKELEKAKKKRQFFNVAILDGQMPEMDGFTLAEKIRSNPDYAAMNILMLSSERRSSNRIKLKSDDIMAYLIKPVKRDALRNALQVAAGREELFRKAELIQALEEPYIKDDSQIHILLVDDSEDNRFLVQAYLKNTNYKLDIAENGQMAIEKFQSNVYDIVLMDVQMPVMDGYTATRQIRTLEKKKKSKTTPIIAMTAHALKEDEQKSLAAGCDAHLTKPIRKPVLLETIRKFTPSDSDGK